MALPDAGASVEIVSLARRLARETRILARASDADTAETLLKAGADPVVIEGSGSAVDLAERVILLYEAGKNGTKTEVPVPQGSVSGS